MVVSTGIFFASFAAAMPIASGWITGNTKMPMTISTFPRRFVSEKRDMARAIIAAVKTKLMTAIQER